MEGLINRSKVAGLVIATLRDADGTVVETRAFNSPTNYLLNAFARWLSGTPTSQLVPPTQIGAGSGYPPAGQTGASLTDTALWLPIAGTQRQCDSISVSNGYYAQFNLTYQTSDPSGPYTEFGLFDANGNMWAHVAVNMYKSSSQTLTVQWMIYLVADTSNASAVITNYTRTQIAAFLTGSANTYYPNQMQLGTGSGTVQPTDNALFNATAGTVKGFSFVNTGNGTLQVATTYQTTDPAGNFTECALIDGQNNVWMHATLSGANKAIGQILSVVNAIQFTSS